MTDQNIIKRITKITETPDKTYTGQFVSDLIGNVLRVFAHDIKKEHRERGTYVVRIKDEAGVVQHDAVVIAIGDDWAAVSFAADEEGTHFISVPARNSFHVMAFDRSDNYTAIYSGVVPGIGEGEVVE